MCNLLLIATYRSSVIVIIRFMLSHLLCGQKWSHKVASTLITCFFFCHRHINNSTFIFLSYLFRNWKRKMPSHPGLKLDSNKTTKKNSEKKLSRKKSKKRISTKEQQTFQQNEDKKMFCFWKIKEKKSFN